MKETIIYSVAKKALPDHFDVEHYLTELFKNAENEWFYPTNKEGDAFTICDQLYRYNIIARTQQPLWKNNSFMGVKIAFKYNKNMSNETAI